MRTLHHATASRPGLALVLLSGTYSEPEDFLREGFVAAVESRGIAAEIAMAQVSAAYFADGSIVERIRDTLILPALARGAERIWLTGISLGGLAAACYGARHADELERMLLISPYPGTREVLREIDGAGGLAAWAPRIAPEGDLEREAWLWLRERDAGKLEVQCYFGSGDRFAAGQRRMAQTLPAGAAHEVPGGHEWKDWRAMWIDYLGGSPR
jgi:pimeloyl-ACP methyl ester carboxylesterase